MTTKRKCATCNKLLYRKPKVGIAQWKTTKFCSRNCLAKSRKLNINAHWKGGVFKRTDGYILIRIGSFPRNYKGKRYDLEHRLVMEKYLGRKLLRTEMVHHKNGITSDNRIENLEIYTQSKHAKIHDLLRVRNKKGQYV